MNEELIRMVGICKNFPGVKALENVDLTVHSGEVHALLGENGAGKSTLIKILNGVYRPDAGQIFVKGEEVTINNVSDAQKLGIGIIFQEYNLCPDINVAENVFIGRQMKNRIGLIDKRLVESETQKVLDLVGLQNIKPTDLVRRMSSSQMQMVEIAKAISLKSDVIVFDEPTAALTESETKTLFKIIRDLCMHGKGIIYISHRMEELREIADTVTVLRDGCKIGESFRFQDKPLDELIRMMVGRELRDKFPSDKRIIGDVVFKVNTVKNAKVNVENIEFRKGEIVGFAGLVGAGRTELMRAIIGADSTEHIDMEIEGKKITNKSPSEAIQNGITYMTEDRKREGLALRMDCTENICMSSWDNLSNRGFVNFKAAAENAERQRQDLQIKTPSLKQKVNLLSGGNQQKVVLAKCLSHHTKVIIFDEPTRGIDVGVKYEIYKIMNQLSARGASIIMISSELPEILGMSDRIYTMHEGKVNGELKREEATQEILLSHIAGLTNA
jgi:ribose transport system ATP-binding protein